MVTCFLIPGKPKGKDRPRFNTTTKAVHTTSATREYEQTVRWSYMSAIHVGERFHSGPCRVEIDAVFSIPKSWAHWRRSKALSGEILPECKPDCDNIAKAVLDALNGIAYKDDSSVTELNIKKRYGEQAHVAVRIESIGG